MKQSLTCIECPVGCLVTVERQGDKIVSVTGNSCPRGKAYAKNEVICPRRIITSTVRLEDGRMLPVKTDRGVKKSEIFQVMEKINGLCVPLPVKIGDVLYAQIAEGCDLVATAEAKKEK